MPAAGLNGDVVATSGERMHARGRHGDAKLVVLDLCRHADVHGSLRLPCVECRGGD